MATKILVRHPATGIVKKACHGFSWTTFFFGFWPALFRGDFLWFSIGFVVCVLGGIFTLGISALIYGVVMAFIYNGMHGRSLIEKGYQLAGGEGENALAAQKWGVMQPPVAQAVSQVAPQA